MKKYFVKLKSKKTGMERTATFNVGHEGKPIKEIENNFKGHEVLQIDPIDEEFTEPTFTASEIREMFDTLHDRIYKFGSNYSWTFEGNFKEMVNRIFQEHPAKPITIFED